MREANRARIVDAVKRYGGLTQVELAAAEPAAANGDDAWIRQVLTRQVAEVLGLRAERVNPGRPLNNMGLDSLMAVELRNRLERELRLKLPIVKILNGGTIASVSEAIREIQAETAAQG
jgi:acyl carrier protein